MEVGEPNDENGSPAPPLYSWLISAPVRSRPIQNPASSICPLRKRVCPPILKLSFSGPDRACESRTLSRAAIHREPSIRPVPTARDEIPRRRAERRKPR